VPQQPATAPTCTTTEDGERLWRLNGELHCDDGPARITAKGRHYFRHGRRHRIGGPAIEMNSGTKAWYEDGQFHREDGPAVEGANGRRQWYWRGQRHREDGPAIDDGSGKDEGNWYIHGRQLGNEEIALHKEALAVLQRKEDAVVIAREIGEGLQQPIQPLKPPAFGR
jgi:hypothetical protein